MGVLCTIRIIVLLVTGFCFSLSYLTRSSQTTFSVFRVQLQNAFRSIFLDKILFLYINELQYHYIDNKYLIGEV